MRDIYRLFDETSAQRVKDIEKVTNHDVKAVEYYIKEEFDKIGGLEEYKEFIHFGLTSQDINNTSVPLSMKDALNVVYYPMGSFISTHHLLLQVMRRVRVRCFR